MSRVSRAAIAIVALACAIAPAAASAASSTSDVLLSLRHPPGLAAFVKSVSDPTSPTYRRYSSVQRLAQRFGASRADRQTARRYLRSHGLQVTDSPTGTYLIARGGRAALGAAFPAGAGAAAAARSGRLPVPPALRGAVAGVARAPKTPQPDGVATARQAPLEPLTLSPEQVQAVLDNYGSIRVRTGTPQGCPEGVNAQAGIPNPPLSDQLHGYTPNQYTTAYGHATMHARGLRGEGMRVAVIDIGGFDPAAVRAFGACFNLRVPPIQVTKVEALGQPGNGASETTLDLEMLVAGAPGLRGIELVQGKFQDGGYVRLLAEAIGRPGRTPNVVSSSLGLCEPLMSGSRSWMDAANDILAVAAGAGISVLDAAGDQGAADCSAMPFRAVDFPTSSPYITSVGGTNIVLDADNRLVDEIAWNNAPGIAYGGGGGLSLIWNRPWWQRPVLNPDRTTDSTRSTPDLAALGDRFPGYALNVGGQWTTVGGTSAASPLTAAGIALADQAAARAGQPPVGFINPLLYRLAAGPQRAQVVNDVVQGNNDIGPAIASNGGIGLGCCVTGPGYDLASGWGSLKIAGFSDAALAAGRRAAR